MTDLKKYVIINYAPDACNSKCYVITLHGENKMQLGVDTVENRLYTVSINNKEKGKTLKFE